jgi:hypothetical protein
MKNHSVIIFQLTLQLNPLNHNLQLHIKIGVSTYLFDPNYFSTFIPTTKLFQKFPKRLQVSLTETLVCFYPLAAGLKGPASIECTEKGGSILWKPGLCASFRFSHTTWTRVGKTNSSLRKILKRSVTVGYFCLAWIRAPKDWISMPNLDLKYGIVIPWLSL